MNIQLLSFTAKGAALAERLADLLPGTAARCGQPEGLSDWTARTFTSADGLVFVGAAGIAVRAIAPHLRSKAADPAVVVVDECGRFAVPVLSGHLGGANDLARRIATLLGAVPVLTTATDANGVFAVDEWAKRQNCAVANPEKIKLVSAKLLAGGTVALHTRWPVTGETPPGVVVTQGKDYEIALTIKRERQEVLHLVPRIAVVGIGCKRGTPRKTIEEAYRAMLEKETVSEWAVMKICSIDRKAYEPGLLEFCKTHNFPLQTFTADELRCAPGGFTASPFVRRVTGVDNVCERSAVLGSGGKLYINKAAGNGVTMAMALAPFAPDWRWENE